MTIELLGPHRQRRRQAAIDEWTGSPLGRHLIGLEQTLVDQVLPSLYGFHLMQVGLSTRTPLYANSMIRHRFSIAPFASESDHGVSAFSEPEQLPIESDSLDVMILHHALEFSDNPHQMLREAARVVVPHGNLIIIGFNRLSLFGLRGLVSRRFGNPVWQGGMLSPGRVADWLNLLDFGIDSVQYCGHGLPLQRDKVLARQQPLEQLGMRLNLPVGASWMIHACKQVSPLIPVRQHKRPRAPRLTVPLPAANARHRTLH